MSRIRVSLTLLLTSLTCAAASGSEPISKNPFTRPGYTADRPLPNDVQIPIADLAPLKLKATLIAGSRTLANISGEILAPGDEIRGHRLLRVSEGEALLKKDGVLVTLLVHDDNKESTRD